MRWKCIAGNEIFPSPSIPFVPGLPRLPSKRDTLTLIEHLSQSQLRGFKRLKAKFYRAFRRSLLISTPFSEEITLAVQLEGGCVDSELFEISESFKLCSFCMTCCSFTSLTGSELLLRPLTLRAAKSKEAAKAVFITKCSHQEDCCSSLASFT